MRMQKPPASKAVMGHPLVLVLGIMFCGLEGFAVQPSSFPKPRKGGRQPVYEAARENPSFLGVSRIEDLTIEDP